MRGKTKILPSGLTDDQLNQLMMRYYAGEGVETLIREFHLAILPSQITRIFPPEVIQDVLCTYCLHPMRRRRVSRSGVKKYQPQDIYCEVCGHTHGSCDCQNCINEKIKEAYVFERIAREKIVEQIKRPRSEAIKIDDLSLWQAITIVALDRVASEENAALLTNIELHKRSFAPTTGLAVEILTELYETGLIDFSLDSPLDAFIFGNDQGIRYYPHKAYWVLRLAPTWAENIYVLQEIRKSIESLDAWPAQWLDQLNVVAQRISLHEGFSYLNIKLNEHGFNFRPGEKSERIFIEILTKYSLSRLYNFIWTSVRDASAYYLRGGVTKQQAANSVVGGCSRRAERAAAEGWDIKSYRRDYRLEESELTATVRNIVTQLGADLYETTWSDMGSRPRW